MAQDVAVSAVRPAVVEPAVVEPAVVEPAVVEPEILEISAAGVLSAPSFAGVARLLRDVTSVDLAALEGEVQVSLLREFDELMRVGEAARAKVLAAVEASGAWRKGSTDKDFPAWRARNTRAGLGAAYSEVKTARTLTSVPGAAEAVDSGRVTMEHVRVLGRVTGRGGAARKDKLASALAKPEEAEELLHTASQVDAGQFVSSTKRWANKVDSMSEQKDYEAQRAERYFTVVDTEGGTFVEGRMDHVAGHRLRLALEAVTPVPTKDDTRDSGMRAADALDSMSQAVLADPETKSGGHVPPHVSVIMTEETLVGLRAIEEAKADPSRTFTGVAFGLPEGFEPATLEDGTPIPVSEATRILCDCQMTRIVLGAESVPLDLGRTKRFWEGHHRRMVIARDRRCFWDGCAMPARYCEIHHLEWWVRDGGRTDINDGVLACTYHHGLVHNLDLVVTRDPGGIGGSVRGAIGVTYTVRDRRGRVLAGRGAIDPPSWARPDPGSGLLAEQDWAIRPSALPVDSCGGSEVWAAPADVQPVGTPPGGSPPFSETQGRALPGAGREPPDWGQGDLFGQVAT